VQPGEDDDDEYAVFPKDDWSEERTVRIKFLKELFFFLKYKQCQCLLSKDNSTAMYTDLKILHPGGI
jgi:hypothetical protein